MSVDAVTPIPDAVVQLARAGGRLPAEAIAGLASVTDILALGALADDVRRRRHGAGTTFVRVQTLDVKAVERWGALESAAQEVRLDGCPDTLDAATAAVRAARALVGDRVLRGFWLDDVARLGGATAFAALATAGLDEIAFAAPGPDAAAQAAEARRAGVAIRVIGVAQPPADRAAWLLDACALADALGDVAAVAPLPRVQDVAGPTTGFDDVRTIALARLTFDRVPTIQVDWMRYGPKLAQVALTVGADDLDAVPASDDQSKGLRRAPLEEVRRNIAAAALVPVERDGRFRRLDA